jgi:hypothetical protein
MAILSVPLRRMHQVPDTANRTIQIAINGTRIFAGTILKASYTETGASSDATLFAFDDRAFLLRRNIGDPDNADYGKVGYNVIFNRNGKPDRKAGQSEFSRYDSAATWWNIEEILSYIGNYYVKPFSAMSWPDSAWNAVPASNENPGELSLSGMSVADAIDSVVQLIGNTTWCVNYDSGALVPIRMDNIATTFNIRYMTNDGDVDTWTASSISVAIDGTRGANRAVAVSGPQLTESEWNTEKDTLIDHAAPPLPLYVKRFVPDPTVNDSELGGVLPTSSTGRPWNPELIMAYTGSTDRVEDRHVIWIKHPNLPNPKQWTRLISGFEITYDPPQVLIESRVDTEDQTDFEITADANMELRITAVTLTDIHQHEESGVPKTFSYDFTEYLEQQQLIPKYQSNSVGPTDKVSDGWVADYSSTLSKITSNFARQMKRTHREVVATLDYPQAMGLGARIRLVPSGGGKSVIDPSTDPLICTGLDYYFEETQQVTIRAENTLGAAYIGLRPSVEDTEVISRWKNTRMTALVDSLRQQQRGRIDSLRQRQRSRIDSLRRPRRFGVIDS